MTRQEPVTFIERLAFALAAHDIGGSEGRLDDDELTAVEFALKAMPAWKSFPDGPMHQRSLRRLLVLERGMRERDGKELMHARLTMIYWRDYLPAALAAANVMMIFPEVAKIISNDLSRSLDGFEAL
jgi:hypothetical protein